MLDPKLAVLLLDSSGSGLRSLVLLGDESQLPSFGPGALLRDALTSLRVPSIRLTVVHRTGAGSLIAEKAGEIAVGKVSSIEPCAAEVWNLQECPNKTSCIDSAGRRTIELLKDGQRVGLVAQTAAACSQLNAQIQQAVNPATLSKKEVSGKGTIVWRESDRVVSTANVYDKQPPYSRLLTNGETGRVISASETSFKVQFESGYTHRFPHKAKDILHAYAMTVHRSQGSEFPHVVVAIDMYESYQSRESLYTAVTRGAQSVTVYSTHRNLQAAIKQTAREARVTRLSKCITHAFAKRPLCD